MDKLIGKSIEFRSSLITAETNAIRLFAGISDGIEGLFLDQFSNFVLLTLYDPELADKKDFILKAIHSFLPEKAILTKFRTSFDKSSFQYDRSEKLSDLAHFLCREEGANFEIHTNPRHDFGLYLDTKSARSFIKKNSKEKNVLNLFSYTCPFGVVAMLGGAESVTNIDPNKDYLAWGGNNAKLNNVLFKRYPDTTQDYLKRHLRRLESGKDKPFDLVIVDPPAFLVGRGSERLARNLWPDWMQALKESQCPEFLIVINDKSFGRYGNLRDFFRDGLGENIEIKELAQSLDVLGQDSNEGEDRFYFTPKIFHITR